MYEFLDLHGLYLHVGTCNQLQNKIYLITGLRLNFRVTKTGERTNERTCFTFGRSFVRPFMQQGYDTLSISSPPRTCLLR